MTVSQTDSKPRQTRLSGILLRRTLWVAVGIGILMSLLQVLHSVSLVRDSIRNEGQQMLAVLAGPARQALQDNNAGMARQVVNGLLHHQAVRSARLGRPGALPLAEQLRPLRYSAERYLTDRLFAAEQHFYLELGGEAGEAYQGRLEVTLDTAGYANSFMREVGVILLVGLLGTVLLLASLHLVLRRLLSRPLAGMLEEMTYIDPERPGLHQLGIAPAHRHNELGQWVERVNQLLRAIAHVNQLREEAEESLLHMSHVDFLTGLPNRLGLQGKLDGILTRARQTDKSVAVMCIGLDAFKSINERYSFQLGDWILRSFAQRVDSQLSAELDSFARLGGDQFILIHSGLDNSYQAAVLAQKVLFLLHQPFKVPQDGQADVSIRLSASIGITLFPGDAQTSELLLQKAEQTMRLSKMGGRNRYQFYIASIDQQLRQRRQMETDLDNALANRELYLLYQPQIELGSNKVVGVEVLLRWQRRNGDLVSPETFIPLAEQTGAIVKIGEWVLEQTCEQLRDWLDIGWRDFRIAVNLSAVQLHHEGLESAIKRIMIAHRIPPGALELEITETSLMQDVETARKKLLALRKLGVAIAIDDFGTGHSSLAYLKRLPLDKIKIDRSFIQDMQTSNDDATIVRTIIQLSHSLQLKVLAEGVETRETEQLLVRLGCDEGQGYLYSKPVTAEALLDKYGRFGD